MTLHFPSSAKLAFLSDMHLSAAMPRTFALWQSQMQSLGQRVDGIFLLGDIFDAWVGDDTLEHDAFARDCVQVLQQCTSHCPVKIVPGNRDFLLSTRFALATGCTLLGDVAVLQWGETRLVLVHGDAQCISDSRYQQFRALARTPQWQQQVLSLSYAARCAMVAQFRTIEPRVGGGAGADENAAYVDCDPKALCDLMTEHQATHLIHGHTHQAQDACLSQEQGDTANSQAALWRHVLSDWDVDHATDGQANQPRGDILYLDAEHATLQGMWRRVCVANA